MVFVRTPVIAQTASAYQIRWVVAPAFIFGNDVILRCRIPCVPFRKTKRIDRIQACGPTTPVTLLTLTEPESLAHRWLGWVIPYLGGHGQEIVRDGAHCALIVGEGAGKNKWNLRYENAVLKEAMPLIGDDRSSSGPAGFTVFIHSQIRRIAMPNPALVWLIGSRAVARRSVDMPIVVDRNTAHD